MSAPASVLTNRSAQRAPRPAPGPAPSARACAPPTAGRALTHAHTHTTLRYGRRTPTAGLRLCALLALVARLALVVVQVVRGLRKKAKQMTFKSARIGEDRKIDSEVSIVKL